MAQADIVRISFEAMRQTLSWAMEEYGMPILAAPLYHLDGIAVFLNTIRYLRAINCCLVIRR
jgi:hypothetical protein